MRFEWDPEKARTNLGKHGIDFNLATRVWEDPYAVFVFSGIVDGEERWQATGVVRSVTVLVVAYTERGEITRIINARKADPSERRRYEQTI